MRRIQLSMLFLFMFFMYKNLSLVGLSPLECGCFGCCVCLFVGCFVCLFLFSFLIFLRFGCSWFGFNCCLRFGVVLSGSLECFKERIWAARVQVLSAMRSEAHKAIRICNCAEFSGSGLECCRCSGTWIRDLFTRNRLPKTFRALRLPSD